MWVKRQDKVIRKRAGNCSGLTENKDGDLIMTKSWRPEGWERLYRFISTPSLEQLARAAQTDEVRFLENEAFEAGADAMLEALKKKGHYVDVSKFRGFLGNFLNRLYGTGNKVKGWYVFIPDDKE